MTEIENLHGRIDGLGDRRVANTTDGGPHAVAWHSLSAADEATELAVLSGWVEWLQRRYAASGDWLPPCWWRHGFAVEELSSLRVAWLAVFEPREPTDPGAGVRWHEAAQKCRERIRRVIGTGPGCTSVSHKPDQSVTDDPRWAKEREALSDRVAELGKVPETPVPADNAAAVDDPNEADRSDRTRKSPLLCDLGPSARRDGSDDTDATRTNEM